MHAIKKIDAKVRFIRLALTILGLWLVANLYLWGVFYRVRGLDATVALASLTVDIGIGILTVYALTWAASEFASAGDKPDIRLRGSSSKTNVSGQTDFSALFQMSLENVGRKVGHNIHLVMRIPALPELIECSFNSGRTPDVWNYGEKHPETGVFSVRVPFKEDLVVYESPVSVGNLKLHWSVLPPVSGPFPKRIPISYDVYTPENVSHGELTLVRESDAGN